MDVHRLKLGGKEYVIVPREEYERLQGLARIAELPALPGADRAGNFPAAEYARASIARDIVRARVEAGLSQRELAKRAGVRVETLCRIETGKQTPSTATIAKLERALEDTARKHKKRVRGRKGA
jgi:ribosome-binding protein aMBF1 (putative translation factor)